MTYGGITTQPPSSIRTSPIDNVQNPDTERSSTNRNFLSGSSDGEILSVDGDIADRSDYDSKSVGSRSEADSRSADIRSHQVRNFVVTITPTL